MSRAHSLHFQNPNTHTRLSHSLTHFSAIYLRRPVTPSAITVPLSKPTHSLSLSVLHEITHYESTVAAMKACLLLCVLFVLSICAVDGAGQHHTTAAPAPSVDCSILILNMADCLSFVSNGSLITEPETSCCTGFKTVLKTDPDCICQAFKSSGQLGVVIDARRALNIPAACGVHDSAAPTCGMSLPPAGAPDATPSMSGLGSTSEQAVTPAPAPKSSSFALSTALASLVLGLVAVAFSSL